MTTNMNDSEQIKRISFSNGHEQHMATKSLCVVAESRKPIHPRRAELKAYVCICRKPTMQWTLRARSHNA